MPPPLLTIYIPTFNRAHLLGRMLVSLERSVEGIDPSKIEVVIRDNASTDQSAHIVEAHAGRLPIRYFKNPHNRGGIANMLSCADEAQGEFIWMLGDDDLVLPDALSRILSQLETYPSFDGHIACHAVAAEEKRDSVEPGILKGELPEFDTQLIRKELSRTQLERFEDVFTYTDIAAALNFLSNVIFRKSLWLEHVQPYRKHCEGREEYSDSFMCGGHLYTWGDMLIGKEVGILADPLVLGFVGKQDFLQKWQTICMVFFLELSRYFIQQGADISCMKRYQQGIYQNSRYLRNLLRSTDPYTQQHFRIQDLLRHHGEDPLLWRSLLEVITQAGPKQSVRRLFLTIFTGILRTPSRWRIGFWHFIYPCWIHLWHQSWTQIREHRRSAPPKEYPQLIQELNQQAKEYVAQQTGAEHIARIAHPVYLKGESYMKIGDHLSSGPGLRMECWDSYQGYTYQPKLHIGERVCFNNNCHVGVIDEIRIGNDVLIGSNVLITDHQHGNLEDLVPGKPYNVQPLYSKGPVIIEENVWIGENACILPGVHIGAHSVIAANAVVTQDVPPRSVMAGIPAKVIRSVADVMEGKDTP